MKLPDAHKLASTISGKGKILAVALVAAVGITGALSTFASGNEDPVPSDNLIIEPVPTEPIADDEGTDKAGITAARSQRALTQKAKKTAVAWWGRKPCGGKSVRVRWVRSGMNAYGWTYRYGRSPKGKPKCTIWINKRYYPKATRKNFKRFCTTMAHEYGHLLGHEHSSNHHHLMSPGYMRTYSIGRCHL